MTSDHGTCFLRQCLFFLSSSFSQALLLSLRWDVRVPSKWLFWQLICKYSQICKSLFSLSLSSISNPDPTATHTHTHTHCPHRSPTACPPPPPAPALWQPPALLPISIPSATIKTQICHNSACPATLPPSCPVPGGPSGRSPTNGFPIHCPWNNFVY